MTLSVYVDGSGGSDPGYGFFVKETGESYYEKKPNITSQTRLAEPAPVGSDNMPVSFESINDELE